MLELDGSQHLAQLEYDDIRTCFLQAQGIRVLRFWNNEILSNIEGVLQQIYTEAFPLPEGEG